MKTVLAEKNMMRDGHIVRLEKIEGVRQPFCTNGYGQFASDKASVKVCEYVVTANLRPLHIRPTFAARIRRFTSLKKAREAFEAFAAEVYP